MLGLEGGQGTLNVGDGLPAELTGYGEVPCPQGPEDVLLADYRLKGGWYTNPDIPRLFALLKVRSVHLLDPGVSPHVWHPLYPVRSCNTSGSAS